MLTEDQKKEITKISKEFAKAFKSTIGGINNSSWMIVDPLSGYLNAVGFENTLHEIPANKNHCQVLIITFKDEEQFIPAGQDLKSIIPTAKNWIWI